MCPRSEVPQSIDFDSPAHTRLLGEISMRVLDRMPDVAIWLDSQGRMIYVNNAACRAFGYTREEMLGGNIMQLLPDYPAEDLAMVLTDIRDLQSMRFELDHCRKDGTRFPAEVRVSAVELEGRTFLCSLVTDISRKRLEEDQAVDLLTGQLAREARFRARLLAAGGGPVDSRELLALLDEEKINE